MKNLVICAIIFLVIGVFSNAGAGEKNSKEVEPVVTFSSMALTKYVDENGAKYGNGAVLQSYVSFSLPKGFYAELWNNTSLTRNNDNRENDLTLGWTGEVGMLEMEVGASYVDIDKMVKVDESDLWKIFGIAKKEFQILENQKVIPFVRGQVYLPVKGSSDNKEGFHVLAGLEHFVQLSKPVLLSQKLSFVYDDGAVGFQNAKLVDYVCEAKLEIAKHVYLTALGRIVSPITNVSDGRRTEIIGGTGIVLSF
jgi:hypothetical protein